MKLLLILVFCISLYANTDTINKFNETDIENKNTYIDLMKIENKMINTINNVKLLEYRKEILNMNLLKTLNTVEEKTMYIYLMNIINKRIQKELNTFKQLKLYKKNILKEMEE